MSTRSHIYEECKNRGCLSKSEKGLENTNIWGDPMQEIHVDQESRHTYTVCSICGHEAPFRDPDAINKTGYPYYNSSADKVFSDKWSERKWARDNGMVAKDYMGKSRARKSS